MFSELLRRFVRMFSKQRAMERIEVWHGISHGFHVVGSEGLILARREEVEGMEIWLFGAFDKNMHAPVSNYLQRNIFSKKLDKVHMERKVATTMKNIYLLTRETTHTHEGLNAHGTGGFTTAIVMNGEKFVAADYGGYKAVVCRDGIAVEIAKMHRRESKGGFSLTDLVPQKFIASDGKKSRKSSKVTVAAHEVESGIEFIILASDSVWKVMNNQEAVDLISHIDNAQTAAEILAKKAAIANTSKSIISCIVIRFH